MKVPLLDLKGQYQTIREAVRPLLDDICESQMFILGPHVERLETRLARYCSSPYAVGVSSGTDALIVSLMAAGVGAGDLVLTSPYTFFATAGAIARVGAQPVFADIDPQTYNMDPIAAAEVVARLDNARRRRLKAVIPVHLYGQCADMDPILDLAAAAGLTVIEDAAQAIGARYKGRCAGSMGEMGCFSFFPSKNLGAFGDGGLVTTRSAALADQLRLLRVHGAEQNYRHRMVGGNFRLDALQAAVIDVKLDYLDQWTAARQRNADIYRQLFDAAGLDQVVRLPVQVQDRHIYNQFVIRVESGRDALKQALAEKEIGSAVYYPLPLHLQVCFADLDYREGDFPEAEKAARQTLALPIFPELTETQLTYVVDVIQSFFQGQL